MVKLTLEDCWIYDIIELREPSAEYRLTPKEKTHQYVDKLIKDVLNDKTEFIEFMKKYFKEGNFEELKEQDIEQCDKEFITSLFTKRESDIIYKLTKEDIYILVEHQSKIDYKMPERIVEYCAQLLISATRHKSGKNEDRPIICPIVLYTGSKKWDADFTIKQKVKNIMDIKLQSYPVYNVIDINNYTKKELLADNSAISKALLFEKLKTKEEIEATLKKLVKKELTPREKRCIQLILAHSNKIKKLLPDSKSNYMKEIEGGDVMRFEELFLELLEDKFKKGEERGERRGEKIGIAKAIKQVVKEMIKSNITDEQIMKIANIDEKELQRLKEA